MRQITSKKISETVAKLCQQANYFLPDDVWRAVEEAYQKETAEIPREIFAQILENARVAAQKSVPLCQDTGITEVFLKLGGDVHVTGGNLTDAVNTGVAEGYTHGYLRKSIVANPLHRKNTGNNTPAQINLELVPGDRLEITVLPKGGGSENASALKMLTPAAGWAGVREFVLETVKSKGISSCPPLIVGVGVGGSFSSVGRLAKKALLREAGSPSGDYYYAEREKELLKEINLTGIGPMGLGGAVTALAVNIEYAPCHIASLPAAVSMQCHSCRRRTEVI
ncbi:MAG: fumarate hydratase [Endomicrobiales bacterium]